MKNYMYAAPHIVGTPGRWGYGWEFGENLKTKRAAKAQGYRDLGHDDFIVAEWDKKCIAVHIDGKRYTNESKDFGEYIKRINEQFGYVDEVNNE